MKISLNWLKDYITFKEGVTEQQIVWRLTEAAAEVEEVEKVGEHLENCVVGKIEKIRKHANADKLKICDTNIGSDTVQIVCGGTNLKEGMLVAVASPGAYVRWHGQGEPVKLEKAKIRGEESEGMICLASELSLENIFREDSDTEILDLSSYKCKPGIPLAEALEISDTVLHIDNHAITHRPDLFSHIGIAREYVALGLANWKKRKTVSLKEGKEDLPFEITTESSELWTQYQGIVITNLDTRESPLRMRRRLAACGIRAINALVDITNYVMLETGMPAHSFDIKKLPGKKFHTRLSRKNEKVVTLDGAERNMPEGVIVIENNNKIVDLCGIMGGENSGIDPKTTEVFFHCVAYEPVRIRKAMIALGHRTDAGTIFEKGVTPELAETGMNRLLEIIMELFPDANVASKRFVKKHFSDEKRKVKITHEKIESVLGFAIKGTEVSRVLTGLGFGVNQTQKSYTITVPFWRKNGIFIPEDIIEEIIRIYGFSNVDMKLPAGSLMPPVIHQHKIIARKIREILAGQGFLEEQNYSFLGSSLLKKFEWKDDEKLIEIINPVSDDFRYMRPSQIPYLLQNAARNVRKNDTRRTYELQKIFYKKDNEIIEKTRLVGIIVEENGALKAKGAMEEILQSLGLRVNFNEVNDLPYGHPGRSLVIESGGEIIGAVYELRPSIGRNFELPAGIGVLEMKMGRVGDRKTVTKQYQKISKFPHVTLDVNVVVDRKIRAKNIEEWIRGAEKDLLVRMSLKDIYEGKNLGDDKKSLTYALTYQSQDHTLEEKEIQNVLNRVIGSLEKNGGVVRR